jgi:hypothetical protein
MTTAQAPLAAALDEVADSVPAPIASSLDAAVNDENLGRGALVRP